MPGLAFRDAGDVLRNATGLKIRDAGNILRTAQTIAFRDAANVLRSVSLGGGLSISPGDVSGYGASNSSIYVTTDEASVVGAPPGATILWHSDNVAVTIVSPTALSTVFRARLASGITQIANVYATVNGVNTASIGVSLTNGGIS